MKTSSSTTQSNSPSAKSPDKNPLEHHPIEFPEVGVLVTPAQDHAEQILDQGKLSAHLPTRSEKNIYCGAVTVFNRLLPPCPYGSLNFQCNPPIAAAIRCSRVCVYLDSTMIVSSLAGLILRLVRPQEEHPGPLRHAAVAGSGRIILQYDDATERLQCESSQVKTASSF